MVMKAYNYLMVNSANIFQASRVSVNTQTDVSTSVKYAKMSKIVCVNDACNEYTSRILGQDVSIRPFFGL